MYDVRTCLSFKNKGEETKHYFEKDNIVIIFEDCNDGAIEIKGKVFCFTDDGIVLYVNGRLEVYPYCDIIYIDKI